jgi:glutathione S-transferase
MIKLWGRRSSSNVQKALWTLAELQLNFEREIVGGGFGGLDAPGFLDRNPNGLIPVLQDGDVTLYESNAIVRYLADRYGAQNFSPRNWQRRAMAEQWMEWQQTTFAPPVQAIFMQVVRTEPRMRDYRQVVALEAMLAKSLPVADRHLADNEYFAGDAISFGDIVMGVMHWRYTNIKCRRPEMKNIDRWSKALRKRAAYKQWVMVPVGAGPAEWAENEKALE